MIRAIMRFLMGASRYLLVAALGLVIGGFSIYVFTLRSGLPFELWHTVALELEFTVGQLGEVRRAVVGSAILTASDPARAASELQALLAG